MLSPRFDHVTSNESVLMNDDAFEYPDGECVFGE